MRSVRVSFNLRSGRLETGKHFSNLARSTIMIRLGCIIARSAVSIIEPGLIRYLQPKDKGQLMLMDLISQD